MDIIFSIVETAAKIIFKVVFTALVKYAVSRITKGKTAPIGSRDGSNNTE
ncbi:MAG: hypothetical protein FWC70_08395 [Defluviitaleaceae bacterium]|nr:hypothetical protein [Defluviitaleaceae bacterium]